MASALKIKVTGQKAILKALEKLERKVARKIVRRVARDIQKTVVLPSIKKYIPTRTGKLKKYMRVRSIKKPKRNGYGAIILNPDTAKLTASGGNYYAGYVQYGTKNYDGYDYTNRGAADVEGLAVSMYEKRIMKEIKSVWR